MLLLNQLQNLLAKNKYRSVIFLLVFLGNLWIWKLLNSNLVVGISVLLATILLYIYKETGRYKYFLISLFSIMLVFQYQLTEPQSLTLLANDQIRVRDMRLPQYPKTYIKVGSKAVWFPIAEWFEEGKEFRVFTRSMKNLSEVIDPNLYFFSNHPRERVGVDEFEKFPYILLPFFLYGVIINYKKKRPLYLLSLYSPLVLISIIGNNNPLGPFSLIPFFVVSIASGIEKTFIQLKMRRIRYKSLYYFTFVIILILLLIQMYSYNVN